MNITTPCFQQHQEFDSTRQLTFYPPEGEFVLMNFRVTGEFRCPFRIFPSIEDNPSSPYKMDVIIRVRADIPEAHHGANVVSSSSETSFIPPLTCVYILNKGGSNSFAQGYS